jgi:hypothetical protein
MSKTDEIMGQVDIYTDSILRSTINPNLRGVILNDKTKLRVMIENAVKVPGGWQLVPVICTPGIESVYANDSGAYQTAQELHDAMLSAAPTYEVKK